MFDGLDLEVILYDEYVDALLDEEDDQDEGDLSAILRQDAEPDFIEILAAIVIRKVTLYSFTFVAEFPEYDKYSLINSGGMTFICTMPYEELKYAVKAYREAGLN